MIIEIPVIAIHNSEPFNPPRLFTVPKDKICGIYQYGDIPNRTGIILTYGFMLIAEGTPSEWKEKIWGEFANK